MAKRTLFYCEHVSYNRVKDLTFEGIGRGKEHRLVGKGRKKVAQHERSKRIDSHRREKFRVSTFADGTGKATTVRQMTSRIHFDRSLFFYFAPIDRSIWESFILQSAVLRDLVWVFFFFIFSRDMSAAKASKFGFIKKRLNMKGKPLTRISEITDLFPAHPE